MLKLSRVETIDFETITADDDVQYLILIGVSDKNSVKIFELDIDEYHRTDYLLERFFDFCKPNAIYYMHNLTFDGQFILNYFKKLPQNIKFLKKNSTLYYLRLI